jgi:tRNA(fMet)-specific endonuclease VapC
VKYLLDSNILIGLALAVNENLRARASQAGADELVTSAVAFAEVIHGTVKGKPPPIDVLEAIVQEIPVLDFDYQAAKAYARLPFKRASYDRLIAAHAMSLDLTVVTNNIGHFADVDGLRVENWMTDAFSA